MVILVKRMFLVTLILISLLLSVYMMYQPSKYFVKKEFVSDGCSMFPDKWHYDCCYTHDKSYWDGGNADDRLSADKKFKQCVKEISGNFTANYMYLGVRTGGHPIFPFSWRWNYGVPYQKGYKL